VRSRLWYVKWPDGVYAEGPHRFREAKTKTEFLAFLRRYINVKRLPNGTEVWPTSDADIDIVGRSNRAPGT
jgi:hypothetical protein